MHHTQETLWIRNAFHIFCVKHYKQLYLFKVSDFKALYIWGIRYNSWLKLTKMPQLNIIQWLSFILLSWSRTFARLKGQVASHHIVLLYRLCKILVIYHCSVDKPTSWGVFAYHWFLVMRWSSLPQMFTKWSYYKSTCTEDSSKRHM